MAEKLSQEEHRQHKITDNNDDDGDDQDGHNMFGRCMLRSALFHAFSVNEYLTEVYGLRRLDCLSASI